MDISKLNIPHLPITDAVIYLLFWFIAIVVTVLAISNIIHFEDSNFVSLAATAIWIFGVAKLLISIFRSKDSIREFLIDYGGMFSRDHMVDLDIERRVVRFGYRLLGRYYYYIHIPLNAITSVGWSSGQATDQAGYDMRDWTVAIWFRAGESVPKRLYAHNGENLYITNPSSPKEQAEAHGLQLVKFLQEADLPLTSSAGIRQFVRTEL
jgi:hypothetical protein